MPNFPQNPYVGQVVSWQGAQYMWDGQQWVNITMPHAATVPVFVSAAQPQPPVLQGTFWFDTINSTLNIWVVEPGNSSWVPVTEQTLTNTCVFVSVSAPSDPTQGALWYNPNTHVFSIWVSNGITPQWEVISDCEPDVDNPPVIVSTSPPTNPVQGTLWYRPSNQTLSLWVDSNTGGSWTVITSASTQQKPTVYISASAPPNPVQGDLWLDPRFKILKAWNIGPTTGGWIDTFPCDLLEAAAAAEESAQQAAASAELAQYYAQQAEGFFRELLIDTSQTGIIYVGKAPAGSLETAAVWTIYKSIFGNSGNLLSEQSATNVAWTNRYTIPYS